MKEDKNSAIVDLESTKGKVTQLLIKFLFFYTWPLALFSWSRILKVGFLPVMVLHAFLLVLLTFAFIKRKGMSNHYLAMIILLFFHLVGLGGIPTHNLVIYAYPSFVIAIVLSTFFYGRTITNKLIIFQCILALVFMGIFGEKSRRFQFLFEIIGYTVFEYYLVKALNHIRQTLLENIREKDRAIETKSRFLAMMSHEIRTPLTGVLLASEQLETTQLDEEGLELSAIIQNSSNSLNTIISDILDFSKIQNNVFTIEKVPFHLETIVNTLQQNYELEATKKGIQFNVYNSLDSNSFVGDSVRIEQILRNLLSNAFKFTREGKIELKIRENAKDSKENKILFEVSDSGIGIDESRIERIFEEFEQENLSTTREYGGTGLGLAIVKNLTEIMDGEVSVISNKGVGTTFQITLPLPPSEKLPDSPVSESIETLIFKKKIHALVVEDNETNAKLISKRLEKLGFSKIRFALNGAEALQKLSEDIYDIVFMDVQMPIMDGLESTTKIREGHAGENNITIPIVGLSANAFDDDYTKGKEAGMNYYLSKPIKKENLYLVLKSLVEKGLL